MKKRPNLVGTGYRWTMSGKGVYPVKEPPPRSLAYLEAESVRARMRK